MKRLLVATALLAITAVGAAVAYQAAAREREYRELIAHGDLALAGADTLAAIEDYSGAIGLRPDSMLAHLRRGETYFQRGDLDNAARDFREASALDPTATRPLERWGDALYQQQRYKASIEAYAARLRLDDRSAVVRYKVGLAQYRNRNLDGALTALREAVRLDGQLADAHYLIGVCLREKNQPAEAGAELERAVLLSPGLIPAREELSDLYAALGRRADQIEQLQMLAGLDGSRPERRIAVGLAHAHLGQVDLAVLTLGSALEQAPDQPLIYGALGRVWLEIAETRRDRPDAIGKALEALERAASSPTATSEVKTLYGRALFRDHQLEAAEQVLQQATERFPVDPSGFATLADVAEQLKHDDIARAALVAYNGLIGDDADFAGRALKIGLFSLSVNEPAIAMAWLTRASTAAPDDLKTIAALAEAAFKTGDREAAQAALKRGLELDPVNLSLRALRRRLGQPHLEP
jgi:tetratricopeptide (TPR) repeat protein